MGMFGKQSIGRANPSTYCFWTQFCNNTRRYTTIYWLIIIAGKSQIIETIGLRDQQHCLKVCDITQSSLSGSIDVLNKLFIYAPFFTFFIPTWWDVIKQSISSSVEWLGVPQRSASPFLEIYPASGTRRNWGVGSAGPEFVHLVVLSASLVGQLFLNPC